jgi:hypothetical protein
VIFDEWSNFLERMGLSKEQQLQHLKGMMEVLEATWTGKPIPEPHSNQDHKAPLPRVVPFELLGLPRAVGLAISTCDENGYFAAEGKRDPNGLIKEVRIRNAAVRLWSSVGLKATREPLPATSASSALRISDGHRQADR